MELLMLKKMLRNIYSLVLSKIPNNFRNELIRRSISLPDQLPSDLVFKIAETTDELEESFRLVYESYLPLGYCSENKYKMRATIYHALPTTTTLIAKDGEKVVGTLTVVRDNRLGLPLDKIFNVSLLRKNLNRLAEITSLVIHKDYRRKKGGQVLFPLLRLMYEYSTSYFGVNHLVVAIHPKDVHFYKSLLLFKDIPNTGVKDYFGAPAITLHLDLQQALKDYEDTYKNRKDDENLFHFFIQKEISNINLPKREFFKINDPLVNLDYYKKVFVQQLNLVTDFSERRKVESSMDKKEFQRDHLRVEVDLVAIVDNKNHIMRQAKSIVLKDISRTGFRSKSIGNLSVEDTIVINVEVAPGIVSNIQARVVWESSDNGAGFRIINSDENWQQFVSYLYADCYDKVA